MKSNIEKQFLNVKELSMALNVPISWVYQQTSNNSIPYYKMGKYVRFDLDAVKEHSKSIKLVLPTGKSDVTRQHSSTKK